MENVFLRHTRVCVVVQLYTLVQSGLFLFYPGYHILGSYKILKQRKIQSVPQSETETKHRQYNIAS